MKKFIFSAALLTAAFASAQNTGIGTTSPNAKLDVRGGVRAQNGLPTGDGSNLGYAFGTDGDTGIFSEADNNANIGKNLKIYINNNPSATILSNGNVGIGTTTPLAKLEISSATQGVLMPRVELTSTSVLAPVVDAGTNGLTVFNTATAGDVTPGYYFWDGTKWVKMLDAKSSLSATEPLQVMGGTTKATSNTENVYQMGKLATGTNNIIEPSAQMEVRGKSYFPLIVNSTVTTTDGSPGAGGIALVPNSDMSKRIELSTTQTGNFRIYMNGLGDVMNINKLTATSGRSYLNTDITVVKGTGNEQAYLGGDGSTNDVQIGSTNETVTDITAWNWTSAKAMNFSGANLIAQGTVRSTALTGTGDRPLVAMPDGTIKIGGVDNALNIYTTNGTLTGSGDRTMDQAGKWLNFSNGGVNITGNSGVYFPLIINAMNTGGNGGISIQPNGDGNKRVELNTTPEGNFRLWAEGDKLNIIRATGRVGIGTGNPYEKLHVEGNAYIHNPGQSAIVIMNGDGATASWAHNSFRVDNKTRWDVGMTGDNGNNYFVNSFNDDGTYKQSPFFINRTNGFIGLNTVTPRTQLEVAGGVRAAMGAPDNGDGTNRGYSFGGNGDTGLFVVGGNDAYGNDIVLFNDGGQAFTIKPGGNVGIGTGTPSEKLEVAGNIRTNAVIYNSDARLKTDVTNITNATSAINGLRSVTYHWNEAGKAKGGNDALQYGFIAQEVEKVLPSLVFTDAKGFKSVNYVAVVPVLVKALQEKDSEVKSLKSEMDKMKAEIEAIKKSLK